MAIIETGAGPAIRAEIGYPSMDGRAAYADVPNTRWDLAINEAIATGRASSQSNGEILSGNNQDARRYILKTRQANELRASLGEFLDLFPIPTGKEKHNPTLKDLQGILKNRAAESEDTSYKDVAAYDPQKLKELNNMLKAIGLTPLSENSTKSQFESTRTRVDSLREEASSLQARNGGDQGAYIGTINQLQTGVQGMIRTKLSIGMGYAKLAGAV